MDDPLPHFAPWADARADALGLPRRPGLDWERDVLQEFTDEASLRHRRLAVGLECLNDLLTVADVQAQYLGHGARTPVAAAMTAPEHERLRKVNAYLKRAEHGAAYDLALTGRFTDFALLCNAVRLAVGDGKPVAERTAVERGFLSGLHGEWLDIIDHGSENDVTRPEDEDASEHEHAPVSAGTLVRDCGGLPWQAPLDTYPAVLCEALAVTVARLPYASPETWQHWQDSVLSAYMCRELDPANDEHGDEA